MQNDNINTGDACRSSAPAGYATDLSSRVTANKSALLRDRLNKAGASGLSMDEISGHCYSTERPNGWTTYFFDGRPILEVGPTEIREEVTNGKVMIVASFMTRDGVAMKSHNVQVSDGGDK